MIGAAAVWSLVYGVIAILWTVTGRGYPLGENDPHASSSLLGAVPADVGAPLFAAVALAGAGIGALMLRMTVVSRVGRVMIIGFGMASAIGWMVIVPDSRALALVGYLPMVVVQAPFDAELRGEFVDTINGVYANHVAVLVGGFLWLAATVIFARRTAGRCENCGRGRRHAAWTAPGAALRWGRIAVAVAVAVPALYALTRWTWIAGFPLGIDDETHAEGMADGTLWAGAWLGSFALVGSILTLGLVQRWGEVFPRWIPGLRGRRVPVMLAVIPASLVSALSVSAGLSMNKAGFADGMLRLTLDSWAVAGPAMLWPVWGVALAAATYAYYLRRRDTCGVCGRGALTGQLP
ncbi:hypothetical protein EF847_22665 [Actinobacteria bacterium YIM 96077]|uniref:Uncharacterized protein n=1 Tax=Phytoactinopolyspora halophila TaxID=1981511 RepID=A0A329QPR3_9ACTN|nr:hypothetical protein EF847_22665 [Actinobacteria bacterium YIM 96077]RAW14156.1 hypothetical protein DPM12_10855 [Phytoactinopolyspora halophila]